MDLNLYVRDIPDFPQKGVVFKDITPLLKNPEAFAFVIDQLSRNFQNKEINTVVSIESRGFIFGAALALKNGWSFVPVRKPGKLPYKSIRTSYTLEYGANVLEMHEDALDNFSRVLIIDDVLATGGTLEASIKLCRQLGADVKAIGVVIELLFLEGNKKFPEIDFFSVLKY